MSFWILMFVLCRNRYSSSLSLCIMMSLLMFSGKSGCSCWCFYTFCGSVTCFGNVLWILIFLLLRLLESIEISLWSFSNIPISPENACNRLINIASTLFIITTAWRILVGILILSLEQDPALWCLLNNPPVFPVKEFRFWQYMHI